MEKNKERYKQKDVYRKIYQEQSTRRRYIKRHTERHQK